MHIKNDIKKEINALSEKRLSHLCAEVLPFEIIGTLADFRSDLSSRNILIEEIEYNDLIHSEKILIESDHYLQYSETVAKFISSYFGAEHIYVHNMKTGDGIIFIGSESNIYAVLAAFHCLNKIAASIREKYMQKLKRYKKQSTKDERIFEYMSDWLDYLTENVRYNSWYDLSDRELFLEYIKNNFKTHEDERKILLKGIEIIKPMIDPKFDPSMTWGEFKNEIFKVFPEKEIDETIKKLNELQTEDIVILFDSYKDRFDEQLLT